MTVSRDVSCIAQNDICCSDVSFFAFVLFCSSVVIISRDVSFIAQSVVYFNSRPGRQATREDKLVLSCILFCVGVLRILKGRGWPALQKYVNGS